MNTIRISYDGELLNKMSEESAEKLAKELQTETFAHPKSSASSVIVNVHGYKYPYQHGQYAKSWKIEKINKNYRTINQTFYDVAHQFPFWIEYGHRSRGGKGFVTASGKLRHLKDPALKEFYEKLKAIPAEKLIRINQYE